MTHPSTPPDDRDSYPIHGAFDPNGAPPPMAQAFYPEQSAAEAEARKSAEFARELLAHTPRTFVYHIIIALNVAIYLAFGLSGGGWLEPEPTRMVAWGANKWELTTGGQWWRVMSSAFLHFGVIHLLANMYALLVVGNLVERLFGNTYFATLYLCAAAIGGLASTGWDRTLTGSGAISAGASGAVFGVYGALIAFVLVRRGAFPAAAAKAVLQSAVVFVGFNVVYGLSTRGISNAAHLGGLVAGVGLGAIMARPIERTTRRKQAGPRMAAALAVTVVAIAATVFALPKAKTDPRAEIAFERAREEVIEDQNRASEQWRKLVGKEGMLRVGEADFDKGSADVIAIWDGALKRIESVKLPETSPNFEDYELLRAYVETRRDAIREYAQAHARKGDTKQKLADELVERINSRMNGKSK